MTAVHSALMMTLSTHFALSKSRLSSLASLITGLAQSRTVNLSHLAIHLPGRALHASHYRRLQRFFPFVRLDGDRLAVLVVQMLNLQRPKCLALDRTNWKIGTTDVNILMLAIVTRRFRVPLLWTFLPHQGCPNTGQRIALMRRYLALFDASSITMLLADREFIGAEWMDFLSENNIKFVIRAKIDMTMAMDDGRAWSFQSMLRRKRGRTTPAIGRGHLNGTSAPAQHPVNFAAKRLKDNEWLIVVTNRDDPRQALNDYRKRWAIECLFGDAKTRGLNLEDTRIRSHDKLSCLLVVVTLAMVWAYRCASKTMGLKAIRRKTPGRREKSWFRVGLDALRNWIINTPENAADAWLHNPLNKPQTAASKLRAGKHELAVVLTGHATAGEVYLRGADFGAMAKALDGLDLTGNPVISFEIDPKAGMRVSFKTSLAAYELYAPVLQPGSFKPYAQSFRLIAAA